MFSLENHFVSVDRVEGVAGARRETRNRCSTWLAQSVEHVTLNLGVVSASRMVGVELLRNKIKKNFFNCAL